MGTELYSKNEKKGWGYLCSLSMICLAVIHVQSSCHPYIPLHFLKMLLILVATYFEDNIGQSNVRMARSLQSVVHVHVFAL